MVMRFRDHNIALNTEMDISGTSLPQITSPVTPSIGGISDISVAEAFMNKFAISFLRLNKGCDHSFLNSITQKLYAKFIKQIFFWLPYFEFNENDAGD